MCSSGFLLEYVALQSHMHKADGTACQVAGVFGVLWCGYACYQLLLLLWSLLGRGIWVRLVICRSQYGRGL
jgi:hypothetical protein